MLLQMFPSIMAILAIPTTFLGATPSQTVGFLAKYCLQCKRLQSIVTRYDNSNDFRKGKPKCHIK